MLGSEGADYSRGCPRTSVYCKICIGTIKRSIFNQGPKNTFQFQMGERKMNFVRNGRKGLLTLGNLTIETPALVIPTRTLTVPHLTGDVLKRALSPSRFIIEAYAQDLLENPKLAQKCPFGIKKLADWNDFGVFLATHKYKGQNLGPVPDFSSKKEKEKQKGEEIYVMGENKTGRIKMKLHELKQLVERFQPDLFITPSGFDAYPGPLNEKMQRRCLENTKLFQEYFSKNLSLPISSHYSTNNSNALLVVCDEEVNNESTSAVVYLRKRLDWEGFLEALKNERVDLFSAGLAVDLAEAGKAIMTDTEMPYLIDLNEVKYRDDDTLLQPGCQCVSCTEEDMGFIKGAIHHYLVVKEMLAPVLLMCHNLCQMQKLLSKLN